MHRFIKAVSKRTEKNIFKTLCAAFLITVLLFFMPNGAAASALSAAEEEIPLYFLCDNSETIAYVKDGEALKFPAPENTFLISSLFCYGSDKCLIDTDDNKYYTADPSGNVNLFIDDMPKEYSVRTKGAYLNRYGILYPTDEDLLLWKFKRFDGGETYFENVCITEMNAVSPNGRQLVVLSSDEDGKHYINTASKVNNLQKYTIRELCGAPLCAFNNGSFVYYAWEEDGSANVYYVGEDGSKVLYKTDADVLLGGVYGFNNDRIVGNKYDCTIYFNKSGSEALVRHDYILYTVNQYGEFKRICELDPRREQFIDFFADSLFGMSGSSGIGGGLQPASFQTGEEDFDDIYFAIRDYSDTGEIPQIYMSTYELYRANGSNIRFIFKCDEIYRICGSNILYSDDGVFCSGKLSGDELNSEWSLNGKVKKAYLTSDGRNGYVQISGTLYYVDNGKPEKVMKSYDLNPLAINAEGDMFCTYESDSGLLLFDKGELTNTIEGGHTVYPTEASRFSSSEYISDDYLLYSKYRAADKEESGPNLYLFTPENGEELLLRDII